MSLSLRTYVLIVAMTLCPLSASAIPPPEPPSIPDLAWEPRSDWVNVKTLAGNSAKGDGVADDTAAIQAALDGIQDSTTIYFPPGTYRITKTLVSPPGRFLGVSLIGHGRSTTLAWDGPAGGRMFWSNDGMPYTRYVGLSWDGRGKAAGGLDHACKMIFENEIRHQHEAYRNFTEAGIRVGVGTTVATAETIYENCLFERCSQGVSLGAHNVLDHTFEGCEFRQCSTGIYGGKGTNFYVRNSHFVQSAESDLYCAGEQGSSARRCTSRGSKRFLWYQSTVGPMVLQDCQIDSWTSTDGTVILQGAPTLIFDCTFTSPPGPAAPIRCSRGGQQLILCNIRAPGSPTILHAANVTPIEVPGGPEPARLASHSFLKSTVKVSGKVFDAKRDFGAKGDGTTDDTGAILKALEAARAHGQGALAYLPGGKFVVSQTLVLSGSDYSFGGSGYRTALLWKGKKDGTTVEVRDAERVTLENIAIGHHDTGVGENAIDILHAGTGKPSSVTYDRVWVFGMYQNKPLDRGLRVLGLGKQDKIHFREINGNIHFTDSAAATIYMGLSYEGTILVEGKSTARDGFLGGSVRLGTATDPSLWVKDNHSIVFSDHYVESSLHLLRMEGNAELPPGRVTLQGAKFELVKPENNAAEINNYRGDLVVGPYQFYVGNPIHRFAHQGPAPFSLTLMGGLFYDSKPEFKLAPTAKLAVLACESVHSSPEKAKLGVWTPPETPLSESIPRIAKALDDLRRLGAVDLEFNHPQ